MKLTNDWHPEKIAQIVQLKEPDDFLKVREYHYLRIGVNVIMKR